MKVDRALMPSMLRVIRGDVSQLGSAFYWDNSPQGGEHWANAKAEGRISDDDLAFLKESYLESGGDAIDFSGSPFDPIADREALKIVSDAQTHAYRSGSPAAPVAPPIILAMEREADDYPSPSHGGAAYRVTWILKLNGVVIAKESNRYPWKFTPRQRERDGDNPPSSIKDLHDALHAAISPAPVPAAHEGLMEAIEDVTNSFAVQVGVPVSMITGQVTRADLSPVPEVKEDYPTLKHTRINCTIDKDAYVAAFNELKASIEGDDEQHSDSSHRIDSFRYAAAAQRKGGWIDTFTGVKFYPLDPRIEDVNILDVAHALSMLCRYNGHCDRFESVSEHSVLLTRRLRRLGYKVHVLQWALLHDAPEAYISDVTRPVKPYLSGYKGIEAGLMAVIAERFGLEGQEPCAVKEYDRRMCEDERRQNMKHVEWDGDPVEPIGVDLQFWTPERAELEFMREYTILFSK